MTCIQVLLVGVCCSMLDEVLLVEVCCSMLDDVYTGFISWSVL